jgi:O-methyltransferase
LYIGYEIKRNKPSLIQPKLGVCAKVCFAYMLVIRNFKNKHFNDNFMKKQLLKLIEKFGYSVTKFKKQEDLFIDIEENEFWEIYHLCSPYTMTSVERMYSLYCSIDYILSNNIEGDFVECGVWRGGSAMLIAKMLFNRNIDDRKIYLYDTFEGMTEPTNSDLKYNGEDATTLFEKIIDDNGKPAWCVANLKDVKNNMKLTKYPENNLIFIEGKVEDTIPNNLPENKIAMLRLDTDWYESTKHELIYMYPIIVKNGILIIDDYGYWKGCRKAVDEYFKENKLPVLLTRIDSTGRIVLKNF